MAVAAVMAVKVVKVVTARMAVMADYSIAMLGWREYRNDSDANEVNR